MRSKLLVDGEERVWALVLDAGEEVMAALTGWAREQRITNLIVRSQITADHVEKARRMDALHRRSPHDSF